MSKTYTIDREMLVNYLGTKKQIDSYYKRNKRMGANTVNSLLKKLSSFCKYEIKTVGRKQYFEIIEIYDEAKNIEDKRVNNSGVIVYENMCRSKKGGIYGLTTEEGLYIGSTKAFKNRHHQHIKSGLANNIKGEFNILWSDGIKDRELLYEIENIAIEIAIKEGIKLVNKKLPSEKHIENKKYKSIKVDDEYYDKVIDFLLENNIDFK